MMHDSSTTYDIRNNSTGFDFNEDELTVRIGWHTHALKKCTLFESQIRCQYCGVDFLYTHHFVAQYLCVAGCEFGLCEACTHASLICARPSIKLDLCKVGQTVIDHTELLLNDEYILVRKHVPIQYENLGANYNDPVGSLANFTIRPKFNKPVHDFFGSIQKDDFETVSFLIGNVKDINARNHSGYAPIHLAVMNKNLRILLKILEANTSSREGGGCAIDCIAPNGKTSLQMACEEKMKDMSIICVLLLYGARVSLLRRKKANFPFLNEIVRDFEEKRMEGLQKHCPNIMKYGIERIVLVIPFHTIWRAELKLKTASSVGSGGGGALTLNAVNPFMSSLPTGPSASKDSAYNPFATNTATGGVAGYQNLNFTSTMMLPASTGNNPSPRYVEQGGGKKGRFILRIMTSDFRIIYLHKDEESNDLMTIRDAIGKGIVLPQEPAKEKTLKNKEISRTLPFLYKGAHELARFAANKALPPESWKILHGSNQMTLLCGQDFPFALLQSYYFQESLLSLVWAGHPSAMLNTFDATADASSASTDVNVSVKPSRSRGGTPRGDYVPSPYGIFVRAERPRQFIGVGSVGNLRNKELLRQIHLNSQFMSNFLAKAAEEKKEVYVIDTGLQNYSMEMACGDAFKSYKYLNFPRLKIYTSCIDLLNRAIATTKFDEFKHNWDNIEFAHCIQAMFGISNEIVNHIASGHWVLLQGAGPDNLYVDSIISVLTQLMLDPYFRTCEGMFLLLQKSWFAEATRPSLKKYTQLRQSLSKSMASNASTAKMSAGGFGKSSNNPSSNDHSHALPRRDEKYPFIGNFIDSSFPYLLLVISCAFSLTIEFPEQFEFNSRFLLDILDLISFYGLEPPVDNRYIDADFSKHYQDSLEKEYNMEDAVFLANYNARGKYYHKCIEKIYHELSEVKKTAVTENGPQTTTHFGKAVHRNPNFSATAAKPCLLSTFTSYPLFFDFIMRHQFNDAVPKINAAKPKKRKKDREAPIIFHEPLLHFDRTFDIAAISSHSGTTILSVTNGRFLTTLPTSFSKLKHLTTVQFNCCHFFNIPPILFEMAGLTSLNLTQNRIQIIPPAITQLINLEYLLLDFNSISSFASIRHLSKLKKLSLNANRLTSFSTVFSTLPSLEKLYLRGNQLANVSFDLITHATRLRSLDLSENLIIFLMPSHWGSLSGLTSLSLSYNKLSDLPFSLSHCTTLKDLDVSNNRFTVFPSAIESLSELEYLDMSSNDLKELPYWVGSLTKMVSLNLSNNKLETLLFLGQMTALTELDIQSNNFTMFPMTVRLVTNLRTVKLAGNPLPPHYLNQTDINQLNAILDKEESKSCDLNQTMIMIVGPDANANSSIFHTIIDDSSSRCNGFAWHMIPKGSNWDFGNSSELASRKANNLTVYDYNLSISKLYSKKNLEKKGLADKDNKTGPVGNKEMTLKTARGVLGQNAMRQPMSQSRDEHSEQSKEVAREFVSDGPRMKSITFKNLVGGKVEKIERPISGRGAEEKQSKKDKEKEREQLEPEKLLGKMKKDIQVSFWEYPVTLVGTTLSPHTQYFLRMNSIVVLVLPMDKNLTTALSSWLHTLMSFNKYQRIFIVLTDMEENSFPLSVMLGKEKGSFLKEFMEFKRELLEPFRKNELLKYCRYINILPSGPTADYVNPHSKEHVPKAWLLQELRFDLVYLLANDPDAHKWVSSPLSMKQKQFRTHLLRVARDKLENNEPPLMVRQDLEKCAHSCGLSSQKKIQETLRVLHDCCAITCAADDEAAGGMIDANAWIILDSYWLAEFFLTLLAFVEQYSVRNGLVPLKMSKKLIQCYPASLRSIVLALIGKSGFGQCINVDPPMYFFYGLLEPKKKTDHLISASSGQNRAGLTMTGHVSTSQSPGLLSVSSAENSALFMTQTTQFVALPSAKSQPYALKLQRIFVFIQEKTDFLPKLLCEVVKRYQFCEMEVWQYGIEIVRSENKDHFFHCEILFTSSIEEEERTAHLEKRISEKLKSEFPGGYKKKLVINLQSTNKREACAEMEAFLDIITVSLQRKRDESRDRKGKEKDRATDYMEFCLIKPSQSHNHAMQSSSTPPSTTVSIANTPNITPVESASTTPVTQHRVIDKEAKSSAPNTNALLGSTGMSLGGPSNISGSAQGALPYETILYSLDRSAELTLALERANDSLTISNTVYRLDEFVPDRCLFSFEGKRFDNSQLVIPEKPFAEGGFGMIYMIRLKQLNGMKDVSYVYKALKTTQQNARTQFKDEISNMAHLKHSNIVRIYGITLQPLAIIMEYCSGGDLSVLLLNHKKPIIWTVRVNLALDVGKGLQYLQGLKPPVAHLDLKTPNVFLHYHQSTHSPRGMSGSRDVDGLLSNSSTVRPIAKIADFGTSQKVITPILERKVDNPRWLAPEIIKGEPYDHKVDTFAYGLMLWEFMSREIPFTEESFLTLIEQRYTEGGRPEIPKGFPIRYTALVEDLWHQNPLERPEMDHVVSELLNILEEPDFAVEETVRLQDAALLSKVIEKENAEKPESIEQPKFIARQPSVSVSNDATAQARAVQATTRAFHHQRRPLSAGRPPITVDENNAPSTPKEHVNTTTASSTTTAAAEASGSEASASHPASLDTQSASGAWSMPEQTSEIKQLKKRRSTESGFQPLGSPRSPRSRHNTPSSGHAPNPTPSATPHGPEILNDEDGDSDSQKTPRHVQAMANEKQPVVEVEPKKPARPKMTLDDALLARVNSLAASTVDSSTTTTTSTVGDPALFVLRHLTEDEFIAQHFPSPFSDPLTHPSTHRTLNASVSAVQAEKMKKLRKKSEGLLLMEDFMKMQKSYLWQLTMLLHFYTPRLMEVCSLEGETRMEQSLRLFADCVLRISEAHRRVYPIWLECYRNWNDSQTDDSLFFGNFIGKKSSAFFSQLASVYAAYPLQYYQLKAFLPYLQANLVYKTFLQRLYRPNDVLEDLMISVLSQLQQIKTFFQELSAKTPRMHAEYNDRLQRRDDAYKVVTAYNSHLETCQLHSLFVNYDLTSLPLYRRFIGDGFIRLKNKKEHLRKKLILFNDVCMVVTEISEQPSSRALPRIASLTHVDGSKHHRHKEMHGHENKTSPRDRKVSIMTSSNPTSIVNTNGNTGGGQTGQTDRPSMMYRIEQTLTLTPNTVINEYNNSTKFSLSIENYKFNLENQLEKIRWIKMLNSVISSLSNANSSYQYHKSTSGATSSSGPTSTVTGSNAVSIQISGEHSVGAHASSTTNTNAKKDKKKKNHGMSASSGGVSFEK